MIFKLNQDCNIHKKFLSIEKLSDINNKKSTTYDKETLETSKLNNLISKLAKKRNSDVTAFGQVKDSIKLTVNETIDQVYEDRRKKGIFASNEPFDKLRTTLCHTLCGKKTK